MSSWWDEDHKLLLLTPLEFAELADGTELTSIHDEVVIKGRDTIDDDTRGGCLAVGVTGDHPLRQAALSRLGSGIIDRANAPLPPPLPAHKMWTCKIGIAGGLHLPPGSDQPMRQAVEKAFFDLTGEKEDFTFSGWGDTLSASEFDIAFPAAKACHD